MKKIFSPLAAICFVMLSFQHQAVAQSVTESSVSAQPIEATPAPVKHPMGVNNRLKRQQNRINKGINNGSLTRGEAKNLEAHEANIATDTKIDKAENGGKLTAQEHKNLEHRLNKQSGRIVRKKHNAKTQ